MADIIERAEAALRDHDTFQAFIPQIGLQYPAELLADLVAELKAARAENERLIKLYQSMSDDYERKYEGFG